MNTAPSNTVLVVGDGIPDSLMHTIVYSLPEAPSLYQVLQLSRSLWLIDWVETAKEVWQHKRSRSFDLSKSARHVTGVPYMTEVQLYFRVNAPLLWLTGPISGVDSVDQIDRPYLAASLVQGFVSSHFQRNVVALIIEEAVLRSEYGELMLTALRREQHSEGLDDAVQIHIVKPDMAVEVAYQV